MTNIHKKTCSILFIASSLFLSTTALAYEFAVMPVRSKAITEEVYQPLVDYLAKASGQPVKLKAYNNFVNYWQDMRDGKLEFVLDAAHFVDYRAKQQDHQVLVKVEDQVSFSLVATEEASILDIDELVGKQIACLPPPSRGNLEIDQMFKNPLRQPRKVEVKSYEDGIKLMKKGKVEAAMLPTAMMGAHPDLNVVESSELWPHMAVTVSNNVPTEVRSSVARALLGMKRDQQGSEVLAKTGLNGFEPTDQSTYDGYSTALKSYGNYTR